MKRTNGDTNQGVFTKDLARGQKLQTPVGKDSSDWGGKASDEIPSKMKMGGGMNNLSDTLPSDKD